MRSYFLMIASLLLMLSLSACDVTEVTEETPTESEGNKVIVTPAVKPSAVAVKVGDTLELQLPTIPMEGYQWVVDEIDSQVLVLVEDPVYIPDDSPESAGGIVAITFKAVGAGSTTVSLSYVSEPTDDTPSFTTNTFSMTVDVTE